MLWILPGPRPSTAYGYSQALDSTWRDYQLRRQRPRARRDRFSDAVDFVGWYAHRLSKSADINLSDPLNLYLAYHEGPSGYTQGRHLHKPEVLAAAKRVAETARLYERQLADCGSFLERRQLIFLVFEITLILSMISAVVYFFKEKLSQSRKG